MKNSLINEFNIHVNNNIHQSDYSLFKDKEELDTLRRNILEKLGDLTYIGGEITKDIIINCMNEEAMAYNLNNLERSNLYTLIENEINGFGPLTELLNDSNVDEIMVNGPEEVFISIDGNLIKENSISFINENHIIRIIKKMIKNTNINIEKQKVFTTKLDDGSILNVILPPISNKGPVLTIKKYNNFVTDIDELLKIGLLTPYMARFLACASKAGLNILVCGSSSSGKTSILNSLANFIDDNKRIITIETVSELNINKNNLITINQNDNDNLLDVAIKMHPNTIVIGEIKDELIFSAIDIMLDKSINLLTTYRSKNAIEVINRIESVGVLKYNYSSKKIRYDLMQGLDLIITVEKMDDNKHRIVSISEFNTNSNNDIVLKEIFAYKNDEFILYNYKPRAYLKIKEKGINDLDDIF